MTRPGSGRWPGVRTSMWSPAWLLPALPGRNVIASSSVVLSHHTPSGWNPKPPLNVALACSFSECAVTKRGVDVQHDHLAQIGAGDLRRRQLRQQTPHVPAGPRAGLLDPLQRRRAWPRPRSATPSAARRPGRAARLGGAGCRCRRSPHRQRSASSPHPPRPGRGHDQGRTRAGPTPSTSPRSDRPDRRAAGPRPPRPAAPHLDRRR